MSIISAGSSVESLESVLTTEELTRRPSRSPDLRAENAALQALARQMASGPTRLLETLVQMAVDLCHAGTGGLSMVETTAEGEEVFRWTAMAGELASYRGGTTPRNFSPCGVTLDRGTPQLFAQPARRFTYFEGVSPPIVEALVVPLGETDGADGTIWIVSHTDERRFDREDARIMTSLAHFTAAAVRLSTTAAENARLYQESHAAMHLRDELIGNVSHDLRTPLTTIKGYAQTLQRRLSRWDDPKVQPVAAGLAKIEHAATRMTTQLDELIDLARLQAGQPLEIRREPTDLVALTSELAAEHGERGVRHRVQVESLVAELVGQWDGARLSRVLDNLISNAVKYSPNGGEVCVRLSRDEGHAVLQIEDHGLGIPEDDLPRIFERFHRAANVTGRIDGIGLGLAGARQIVDAHDGSIAIQSQEGVGTTVTVRLPLEENLPS